MKLPFSLRFTSTNPQLPFRLLLEANSKEEAKEKAEKLLSRYLRLGNFEIELFNGAGFSVCWWEVIGGVLAVKAKFSPSCPIY